jgi:hypothetical protein
LGLLAHAATLYRRGGLPGWRLTRSGALHAALLAGLALTGGLRVLKNLPGAHFGPFAAMAWTGCTWGWSCFGAGGPVRPGSGPCALNRAERAAGVGGRVRRNVA